MPTYLVLLLISASFFLSAHSTEPCVVHLESPIYDRLARRARLEGDVSIKVKIGADGKVVTASGTPTHESGRPGHKLLVQRAESNVRTWVFAAGTEKEIEVVYEFRLEVPEIDGEAPSRVTFDLPRRVRIVSNFHRLDHM